MSSAQSEKEAAQIIVETMSELFTWDACNLSLYLPENDSLDQVYVADTFDGVRQAIANPPDVRPSSLFKRILAEGAELILRKPADLETAPETPFGNPLRRSASLMFAPLRNRDRSVGIFTVQSYSLNCYSDSDLKTLQALADHCSGALDRLRADRERARVEQRNNVFNQLGKSLSSARTPSAAAQLIIQAADQLFSWDACSLDLYIREKDELRPILVIDTINGIKTTLSEFAYCGPSPMARRVIEKGSELILRTPQQTATQTDGLLFGDQTRLSASLMNVPIRWNDRCIGFLSLQSYTFNAYKEPDLLILESLADHCGGALERIRIETDLRSSQVRFHSVWENSVDGMRLTDEDGIIVAVNEAYCRLVGMRREELEGQPFTVTYAETERLDEFLQRYRTRFKKRIVQKQVTRRMKFRSGKTVDLEDTNSFIDSADGKPLLLALFRDVTTQKQLEEDLRQSQKMESVGQLAGGIAHDFNNILTVISGHASLLLMGDHLPPNVRESVEQIFDSSERAANLTRQLLAFSRKQVMQPRNLDLNSVVSDLTKILQRVLGEHINLRVGFSSIIPLVHADRGMMEQIILNLAVNARDAMSSGGTLLVQTSVTHIDETDTRKPESVVAGLFVCLRVSDTGAGIPKEFIPKIFEPFFTTKDVGKGTGLGLATVYGITKQHGGFIQVNSELDRGTVFEIFLPKVVGVSDEIEIGDIPTMPGGSETILLVEDEPGVRTLAVSILKRLGYRCLEADNGAAALNLWKE
ncbi:MAG: PAS domain S-box protein, partial [Limisphaerales bacterium]